MTRHFPYVTAIVTTAAVGAITSVVFAAQVPVLHPGGGVHASVAHPAVAVAAKPSTGMAPIANLGNAPGTGPVVLPPGFQQSAAFGSTGMSQAGQPPFGEMFFSLQTYMNQPGQPDYYDRLGMNPTAIQASEGYAPVTTPTPTPMTTTTTTTTATTALPNSIGQQFTPTNTGTAVGFYNGFGPGNPNFGFYNGFTAPR
jgi:hypothetical protein